MTRSGSQSPSKPALVATAQVLRKQRAAIAALAADNHRLKEELMEENKYSAHPTTQAGKNLIQNLENQDRTYEVFISEQQEAMDALLAKEADLWETLVAQRAAMGGINRALEVSIRAQRRVVLLENRVQQAATARSTAELQAAKLKEKVDGLRREKKLFEELTAKMEANLTNKAREVAEILKKTVETHDAKGKAEAMRAQVINQTAKDAAASEAEWAQMTEVVDSDRARREATNAAKSAERARRMEELMAKQKAVASGRSRHKPTNSATAAPTTASAAGVGHSEILTGGFLSINDPKETEDYDFTVVTDTGTPVERLRAMEEKLAAVVAGIAECQSAEHAVGIISDLKELCFRLFASLTEGHTRLEALEDRVGQIQEATTAAASNLEAASGPAASEGSTSAMARKQLSKAFNNEEYTFTKIEEELKLAEQQVQAVCTEVHHLSHRVRSKCPEIDTLLEKEGAPTTGTLLLFIGMLEHWATAALHHHTSSSSTTSSGDGAASGEGPISGGKKFWAQYEDRSSDNGGYNGGNRTALLDPPSVGHRNSLSGRSSSSGSSGSAGGAWRRKSPKSKRGRGNLHSSKRQSQATSESSDMSKVMDFEVLAQRAKRAVEMRLADATAVTVTAHSTQPTQEPDSD